MAESVLNINNISPSTHAMFDTFAEHIMEYDLQALLNPRHDFMPHRADGLTMMVLKNWKADNIISKLSPGDFCALDIAMATIFVVLKKRGLSLEDIKAIKTTLNSDMYNGISMLAFVVLLCNKQATQHATCDKMPLLVIDGNNRVCVALSGDLPAILCDSANDTYSYTILNLYHVLNNCEFRDKIQSGGINPFIELPAKIVARLNTPGIKRVVVDIAGNTVVSELDGGELPQFGERITKYQDGHIVSDIVKVKERLHV